MSPVLGCLVFQGFPAGFCAARCKVLTIILLSWVASICSHPKYCPLPKRTRSVPQPRSCRQQFLPQFCNSWFLAFYINSKVMSEWQNLGPLFLRTPSSQCPWCWSEGEGAPFLLLSRSTCRDDPCPPGPCSQTGRVQNNQLCLAEGDGPAEQRAASG